MLIFKLYIYSQKQQKHNGEKRDVELNVRTNTLFMQCFLLNLSCNVLCNLFLHHVWGLFLPFNASVQ